MSKTITAVGIEKIGRRLADSIDRAAYTLNGEPKTVEPFRRLVSADEVKIYVYFDDTVTGTVGDVQLVDTDGDVIAATDRVFEKPPSKGLYVAFKYKMWLSHLISQTRKRYRQNQTLQQGRAKVAAAEAEGKLVQIGLEVFLGQAMIGAQDKRFGVADHDVQPMEQAGIGVVGFVFMRVAFQSRKVTAITIAVDHAAIGEGGMGKFLHRCLLDVGRYPHFQKAGIALLIQSQRHENLLFFCASAPLFTYCWAAKVRIIKFDDTAQLMGFIPLAHSGANAPEHGPCGFVGSPKHRRQLHSGNTPLILAHEIERQKPLRQWHMGFVQHRPCCYRGLIAALGALISPVGQPVSMVAATFGANIPVLPAQRCQILLALCLAGKSLQKRPKWQALLLCHDSFPPLFGIMALFYHALCPIIWDFPRLS